MVLNPSYPQQGNGYDCGVYTCWFMKRIRDMIDIGVERQIEASDFSMTETPDSFRMTVRETLITSRTIS
jgi:Ulp1 family protease